MADREIYNKAMNTGHSAAWDQQWDRAIAAYGRAVQEFPEDPDAHRSLGLALLQARRLEEALKVYTRAHQLAPDDPIPLEKSADVLERMGRLREAAQQYIKVADIYIAERDLDKAIGNWERATHLTPGLIRIHAKLATAYERTGITKNAVREYLTLAFNFQRGGDTEKAIQAVQRALRLDRSNPQALNTLQALQSGTLVKAPESEDYDRTTQQRVDAFDAVPHDAKPEVADSDPRGPLGEAEEFALGELATFVFEGGDLSSGSVFAIQAIELHRQGEVEAGIQLYKQTLDARLNHDAVYLGLGALTLISEDPKGAIEYLAHVENHPSFGAGANHGLGQAYMKLEKPHKAATYLVETLRLVDLSMVIDQDEIAQLNAVYDSLAHSVTDGDPAQILAMNERFFGLLTGPDWKRRVAETRRQLEDAAQTEGAGVLVEVVAEGSEELTEAVSRIDRYMRDGYTILAMDETHHAIGMSPSYLPVHLRIAQLMLEEGKLQDAINKYKLIADTYLIRDQTDRASHILNDVLRVAPMDLGLRNSLIELLEREERWSEVLDQYINLADAYYQLADYDTARNTYAQAQRLAEQQGADQEQIIHILHRIADINVTRMDLRQAMRNYEQIKSMSADDERSRKALMDLNYRLNNRLEAVKELDALMSLYARQRRPELIEQVLAEQVTMYPNDIALRSRLAAFYTQLRRTDDAVVQLDALGELQLEAGLHSEAAKTIRQIVALNPPGIEDYQRLLNQLGG